MRRINYIPEALIQPLDEEAMSLAGESIEKFQQTPGWYRVQQKLEKYRDENLQQLINAARLDHARLSEAAGAVRAIDEFYNIFEKIKKEGESV